MSAPESVCDWRTIPRSSPEAGRIRPRRCRNRLGTRVDGARQPLGKRRSSRSGCFGGLDGWTGRVRVRHGQQQRLVGGGRRRRRRSRGSHGSCPALRGCLQRRVGGSDRPGRIDGVTGTSLTVEPFAVLGDPARRRILEVLAGDEQPSGAIVEVISAAVGIGQPAVSMQLKVLRDNGFVQVRPEGARRIYTASAAPWHRVASWLGRFRSFWDQPLDALGTELARGKRRPRETRTDQAGTPHARKQQTRTRQTRTAQTGSAASASSSAVAVPRARPTAAPDDERGDPGPDPRWIRQPGIRSHSPCRTAGHSWDRMENTAVSRKVPSPRTLCRRSTPSRTAPSLAIAVCER